MPIMPGFHELKNLPEEKITDQISRRILIGDKQMIVWWSMKAGAHAAAHRHPHEQVFWVLTGRMDFRLGDSRRACGPGDLGVVPSNVEHEAWFPTECEVIDVFAPRREDFLTADAPAYMRKG
jgi:quercetin dioxygenase-like cupin family protein